MAVTLPAGTDYLNSPDHALRHRIVAIDENAAEQSILVNSDNSVTLKNYLDMGSNLINNVTDPSSAQDAATKNYVDINFLQLDFSNDPSSLADGGTWTIDDGEGTPNNVFQLKNEATFAYQWSGGYSLPIVGFENWSGGMTGTNWATGGWGLLDISEPFGQPADTYYANAFFLQHNTNDPKLLITLFSLGETDGTTLGNDIISMNTMDGLFLGTGDEDIFGTYDIGFGIWDGTGDTVITNTRFYVQGSTGNITTSGDLRVDGGDIGITADTDLIQLSSRSLTINGAGTLTLGATEKLYLNATSTIHTGTAGALDIDFRTGTANANAVNIGVTLTDAVDEVGAMDISVTAPSGGMTGEDVTHGVRVTITGDDNDSEDHEYSAFIAGEFTGNGGDALSIAYTVGTGYSDALVMESGQIVWDAVAGEITTETENDSAPDLYVHGGDADDDDGAGSPTADFDGGIVYLYGGLKANAGADGYVSVDSSQSSSPTQTLDKDSLYIKNILEIAGTAYFNNDADDYLTIATVANVPTITAVGDCNMKFVAGEGVFLFEVNKDGATGTCSFTNVGTGEVDLQVGQNITAVAGSVKCATYFEGPKWYDGGDLEIDASNISADSTLTINNSQASYACNVLMDGDLTLDYGSGDSPVFKLQDGDDNTLTIQKTDAGATFIDSSEGAIGIRPAGDTTNYLYFSVSSGVPFIGSVGANDFTILSASGNVVCQDNFYIDKAAGDSPLLRLTDGDDNYLQLKKDDDGWASIANNEGAIYLFPSGDADDFFSFEVVGDVPTLNAVGANLKITAAGGTVDFDNEDLTTTGAVTDKTDFKVRTIGITIDGAGSAITTGVKGYIEVPYACTINQVTMLADVSGSAVVDIWKDTYANYPPTDADSITASAVPTITTATKSQDATLTGWTTAITAGDILGFNVDSAATITRLHVILKVTTDV